MHEEIDALDRIRVRMRDAFCVFNLWEASADRTTRRDDHRDQYRWDRVQRWTEIDGALEWCERSVPGNTTSCRVYARRGSYSTAMYFANSVAMDRMAIQSLSRLMELQPDWSE